MSEAWATEPTARGAALVSTAHASSYWLDRADRPAPRPRVLGEVTADLVVVGGGFTGRVYLAQQVYIAFLAERGAGVELFGQVFAGHHKVAEAAALTRHVLRGDTGQKHVSLTVFPGAEQPQALLAGGAEATGEGLSGRNFGGKIAVQVRLIAVRIAVCRI